jgi:hypothetical protein
MPAPNPNSRSPPPRRDQCIDDLEHVTDRVLLRLRLGELAAQLGVFAREIGLPVFEHRHRCRL